MENESKEGGYLESDQHGELFENPEGNKLNHAEGASMVCPKKSPYLTPHISNPHAAGSPDPENFSEKVQDNESGEDR